MENKEKNAPIIKQLEDKQAEIKDIREFLSGNYSNRENSLTITSLRQAEHWLNDQIEALK